jgi:hypothetical protein
MTRALTVHVTEPPPTVDIIVRVIHNMRAKLNTLAGLPGSDVNIGMAVTK